MDRFDSGRSPTLLESGISGVLGVLCFPIIPLLKHVPVRFPGLWGYLPFVANSAIWGATVCLFIKATRKKDEA